MSTPAAYESEPVAEIPEMVYRAWLKAREAVALWEKERDRLRAVLEDALGDAWAGTVDGQKVITNRPGSGYATAKIVRDYPDLAKHFMVSKLQETLNTDAFVKSHPEIAERYRIRSFREVPVE